MSAAQSTVEALTFQLRSGIDAFANPNAQRRLSELDDHQLRSVIIQLQKFKLEIARAWTPEEIEILLIARSKLNVRQ